MNKRFINAAAVLLFVLLCITPTGCAAAEAASNGEGIKAIFSAVGTDLFGEKEQVFETLSVSLPGHSAYETLEDKSAFAALTTDEQRDAYESIEKAIFNITDEWCEERNAYYVERAVIPVISSAEIFMVKEAVLCDHPEAFWITGKYDIGSNMHDGLYVMLYSAYSYKDAFTKALALQRNVIALLREIPSNRSEYQRELLIHDILVRDTAYASEAVDMAEEYTAASTVYGALVEHRAICSGYAQAFKLLCNRTGIACSTVKGESKGEGHMWNLARISGSWYHVDVTWDDPVTINAEGIARYDYLNLTDAWICYDHKVAEDYSRLEQLLTQELDEDYRAFFNFPLPVCSSVRYNFYEQNAVNIAALNDEYAEKVEEIMKSLCLSGDCFMYLEFPEAMDPSKVVEWINNTVIDAMRSVNIYAEANGGSIVESCVRTVRADQLTPWSNVYCIRLQYYSE